MRVVDDSVTIYYPNGDVGTFFHTYGKVPDDVSISGKFVQAHVSDDGELFIRFVGGHCKRFRGLPFSYD